MRYMSVCSGIEAATVAWHPLGWEPVIFCEIDRFPARLLQHYYPQVPNLGDMTKLSGNETYEKAAIDLLVGGTPCQSFSIAGLRKGLDSANGNLALVFCRILLDKQPPWFVWENVPGVFSSFSGKKTRPLHPRKIRTARWKEEHITETSDFASILNAFQECGYSVSYRVFDSQYFGVPQRRRRVFVVGYLGNDWRPPAAVLFERESMRRDLTPSREKGEEVAGTLDARTNGSGFPRSDGTMNGHVIAVRAANTSSNGWGVNEEGIAYTCDSTGGGFVCATLDASYAKLQGSSGQDLNHGHSHLVIQPAAFMAGQGDIAGGIGYQEGVSPTLKSSASGSNTVPTVLQPICFQQNIRDEVRLMAGSSQITGALSAQAGMKQQNYVHASFIRRLTPLECERLQGFPDNYTNIPGASDSARYKAIGNSMTVQVMRWIGERIQLVHHVIESLK